MRNCLRRSNVSQIIRSVTRHSKAFGHDISLFLSLSMEGQLYIEKKTNNGRHLCLGLCAIVLDSGTRSLDL